MNDEVTVEDNPELFHALAGDREWSAAVAEGRQAEYEAELNAGRAGRCPLCAYPMTEDEATPWYTESIQQVPDPKLGGHPQNCKWSELVVMCPECVSERPNRDEPYRGHWYRPHLIEVINERNRANGQREVVPA